MLIGGATGLQAVTIDLSGGGTSSNGFYYWNDASNWRGGVLPGTADAPRLRYAGKDKVLLAGDVTVAQVSVYPNIVGQIGGTGTLTLNTYLLFTNAVTLDIRDSVNVVVMNRIRFEAQSTQMLNLYDNACLRSKTVSFDGPGSKFTITLNGNAIYDGLIEPNAKSGTNIASGSKFILNNSSSLTAPALTAQKLYDQWIANGVIFCLNDTAKLVLKTSGGNAADIALFVSSGYIQINGLTNAVSGKDYVYDANTGVLQAAK